jgi:hypothetical protein
MTSSWRWDSDDEFRDGVQPHAINKVAYVRQSWTIFSFAQIARRVYEDLTELRAALERLEALIKEKETPLMLEQAARVAVDVCHFGESILRYQKRLALSDHAYGFLNGKEAIPHAAHQTTGPPTLWDLRQLAKDTQELLAGFNQLEVEDADFLVHDLHIPDDLERDFRLARDLFSVGFDGIGLLIAGRGLEGVLRRLVTERAIRIGSYSNPAEEASFKEIIEALRQHQWGDGSPVLTRDAAQMLHWLRETRNVGAHPSEVGPFGPPREVAPLIARAAEQLWKRHKVERA